MFLDSLSVSSSRVKNPKGVVSTGGHFTVPMLPGPICHPLKIHKSIYNKTSLIQTLVIWIINYPDQLDPSGKFV